MRVKILLGLVTLMWLSACAVTPVSEAGICDGTAAGRKALAEALLMDGGVQSRHAGLGLLDQVRAGCG